MNKNMNKIKITYNRDTKDTQNSQLYKYALTLVKINSKNKSFMEIDNEISTSFDKNIHKEDELANISKFSSLLTEMGVIENEVVMIPSSEKNSFQIIGITSENISQENYFRNISNVISKIITKVSNLNGMYLNKSLSESSNNSLNNIIFDISNYSSQLQQLIITCLEYENYSFKKYIQNTKKINEKGSNDEQLVEIIIKTTLEENEILTLKTISTQTSYCKDLVNSNACEITSEYLHKELEEFSEKFNLEFKAIIGEELLEENMNLHYQVGKSASIPPRMLCATYKGDSKSESFTALVGKGITFDTGGINLKPTGAIEDMKLDMAGAATTLSAFKALVEMNVEKNIVLVLGCAENSIDSLSYKPGDVFVSRKGISVEITNTDAEGRLVLADCMDYVQEKFNIKELIDCATLTGASMIALGLESIAMFSNDNAIARRIYQSSKDSYELMWRLPIFDEHREVLKSTIANCSNAGSGASRKFGGASSAAAFLEQFVKEDVKWVHLDIAGSSFNSKRGASGAGVRTLVEYLKN